MQNVISGMTNDFGRRSQMTMVDFTGLALPYLQRELAAKLPPATVNAIQTGLGMVVLAEQQGLFSAVYANLTTPLPSGSVFSDLENTASSLLTLQRQAASQVAILALPERIRTSTETAFREAAAQLVSQITSIRPDDALDTIVQTVPALRNNRLVQNLAQVARQAGQVVTDVNTLVAAATNALDSLHQSVAANADLIGQIASEQQDIFGSLTDPQVLSDALSRAQQISSDISTSIDAAQQTVTFASTLINIAGDSHLAQQVATVGGAAIKVAQTVADVANAISSAEGIFSSVGAIATGNFIGAALDVFSMFGGSLFGGSSGPSPDQVILDQINAVRQDIANLSAQMNARFDRVDAALTNIVGRIDSEMSLINSDFNYVANNLAQIRASLLDLQGQVQKLESQIYTWLTARKPDEFRGSGIFTEMEENFIKAGLDKLYRRRELPYGSGEEKELSQKLKALASGALKDVAGVRQLGEAYRKTLGGYFILHPLKDSEKTRLGSLRQQAERDRDTDLLWFCTLAERGHPKSVSNFRITCHFTLVREDETRHRIVSLENRQGEKSCLKSLDSRAATAPRDFRQWLANAGNYNWEEGEKELEKLLSDLFGEAAFFDVLEVTSCGQHQPSGLWLYKDVAFGPNGEEILSDEHGVFWGRDGGYKLSAHGSDEQSFRQPLPQMHPGEGLVLDGDYKLAAGVPDDSAAVQGLFQELAHGLRETLGGGPEGYLAIGSFLAFAAAREIFERQGCFPGLWITGEKGGGKTTLTQLLMEFFGFHMQSGIGLLRNSSAAGLQIAVEQFSNLPVWVDEWRELEVHPDKRAIIHSAYNRELPSKYADNGRMRAIRTAFIVVGESTTSDAATRSRYPHIHVSKSRRRGDHLSWFQKHRSLFFVFGRFLMRNRPEFSELVLKRLAEWLNADDLPRTDERAALVYGVPYAAFIAMTQLLKSHVPDDLELFRKQLVDQAKAATDEVHSQTDVHQVFEDLHAAFINGAFGNTPGELKRYFRAERKEAPHPPDYPNQNQIGWVSYDLYFKPTPVLDVLRRYKRAQGQDLRLSQLDLRRQMATKSYWLPPKHRMHRKRFDGKNTEGCWGIDLDFHPLGRQEMTDAEWHAYLEKVSAQGEALEDPRQGELFAIVHKLFSKDP
jgi:hypothetical protein